MEILSDKFYERSKEALENENLQRVLQRATSRFVFARNQAFSDLAEGDALRTKAREIKERVIEQLDKYLVRLEAEVAKAGGAVHWARDSLEACQIIVNLALERRVKCVVKSKSMATEEIALNEALESAGIRAVETDLGEYIIQLARERPSHIIVPAIHKSKLEVAELFVRKLGVEQYEQVEDLTKAARSELREKFLHAEMGITGVNFAVAETGTIVIVENEGNARLSTTIPPIHVAVMGIEKVVPRLEDLAIFLKILARSATGQKMTSYVSFITGPRGDREIDGAKEFHLVLLDNGRTRLLRDEVAREALYCLRCGACLNVCPVYQKIGGHAYGWIYPGPIGAVITPLLVGLDKARDLPYASSLCGACRDVCPVKINIPYILLKLREKAAENRSRGSGALRMERIMIKLWARCMSHSKVYALVCRSARLLQRPFVRDGRIAGLPFLPFSRWTAHRDFPTLAEKSFHDRWKEIKDAE